MKVIFVAGAGRSGSTLLDGLLGSAPGVCSVGELRQLWRLGYMEDTACGCGLAFSACPFWREVTARAFGGAPIEAEARHESQRQLIRLRNAARLAWPSRLSPELRAEAEAWHATQARLFEAIAATAGADTIVDSTKNPMYGLLLASMPGVDLRVVHLVRDSRAVAYSWANRLKYEPGNEGRTPLFDLTSHRNAATWWTFANLGTELAPPLHRRYRRVYYEDFAREPARHMAALCRFAGIETVRPQEGTTDVFDLGEAPHHSIGGNPVRFHRGGITIRADEEWRRKLPRRGRLEVTAFTLPLLLRYGYLVGRRGRRGRPKPRSA